MLAQTFGEWECICVDDGSTDGSGAILDEYAAKDKRFKVFHQKNAGVSTARNKGLDVAKGDWVMFCDSDDAFTEDALAVLKRNVSNATGMIVFGMQRVNEVTECVAKQDGSCERIYDMSNGADVEDLVGKSFPHRLWAWNKCFRADVVRGSRFENYQPCEDAVFVLDCMFRIERILEISDVLYKYVQHEGSCLRTVSAKRMNGDVNGMRRLCEVILSSRFANRIRPFAYQQLRDVFLRGIARRFGLLSNVGGDVRTKLLNEFFNAANLTFVQSELVNPFRRIIYKRVLGSNSVDAVNRYFHRREQVYRIINLPRRILGRLCRMFGIVSTK